MHQTHQRAGIPCVYCTIEAQRRPLSNAPCRLCGAVLCEATSTLQTRFVNLCNTCHAALAAQPATVEA